MPFENALEVGNKIRVHRETIVEPGRGSDRDWLQSDRNHSIGDLEVVIAVLRQVSKRRLVQPCMGVIGFE